MAWNYSTGSTTSSSSYNRYHSITNVFSDIMVHTADSIGRFLRELKHLEVCFRIKQDKRVLFRFRLLRDFRIGLELKAHRFGLHYYIPYTKTFCGIRFKVGGSKK